MTLLEKLDRLPPCVCRLLARHQAGNKVRGLSHEEIAARARLPKSTVADLSFKRSWRGVPVDVVQAFSAACGVDILRVQDAMWYLAHGQMDYTETGNVSQMRMYTRLLTVYADVSRAAR